MEWIKCSDRTPQHGERVLAYQSFPEGTVKALAWPLIGCPWEIAEYGSYGKGFIGANMNELAHVSHWMPLPQPPKSDN